MPSNLESFLERANFLEEVGFDLSSMRRKKRRFEFLRRGHAFYSFREYLQEDLVSEKTNAIIFSSLYARCLNSADYYGYQLSNEELAAAIAIAVYEKVKDSYGASFSPFCSYLESFFRQRGVDEFKGEFFGFTISSDSLLSFLSEYETLKLQQNLPPPIWNTDFDEDSVVIVSNRIDPVLEEPEWKKHTRSHYQRVRQERELLEEYRFGHLEKCGSLIDFFIYELDRKDLCDLVIYCDDANFGKNIDRFISNFVSAAKFFSQTSSIDNFSNDQVAIALCKAIYECDDKEFPPQSLSYLYKKLINISLSSLTKEELEGNDLVRFSKFFKDYSHSPSKTIFKEEMSSYLQERSHELLPNGSTKKRGSEKAVRFDLGNISGSEFSV